MKPTVRYTATAHAHGATCPMRGCSQWFGEGSLRALKGVMDRHLSNAHGVAGANYRLK